jgi:hypothetical protein
MSIYNSKKHQAFVPKLRYIHIIKLNSIGLIHYFLHVKKNLKLFCLIRNSERRLLYDSRSDFRHCWVSQHP